MGAVIFHLNSDKPILKNGKYYEHGTNNQAEYMGLIIGLKNAIKLELKNILINGDSNLVINQCSNKWKTKDEQLKELNDIVLKLFEEFDNIAIKHIYRDFNKYADGITRKVFKKKKSYIKHFDKVDDI